MPSLWLAPSLIKKPPGWAVHLCYPHHLEDPRWGRLSSLIPSRRKKPGPIANPSSPSPSPLNSALRSPRPSDVKKAPGRFASPPSLLKDLHGRATPIPPPPPTQSVEISPPLRSQEVAGPGRQSPHPPPPTPQGAYRPGHSSPPLPQR